MIVCSILLLLFCKNHVNLADVFMQPHRSVRAQLGGSVILECHMPTHSHYTYIWIKLTPRKAPDTIAFWSKRYNEYVAVKENENVKYEVMNSSSSFNLSITHLDASALGTYYCGVVMHRAVLLGNGTEVCLTGHETVRGIFQPPVLKPVQYGDNVTLECIINRGVFGDAHQVFWIHRTIRGSYQTIRSTHEKRKCVIESEECVYSLLKNNFSFQDVGTYYCAFVTCGEVILGNGTEFPVEDNELELDPIVLVLGMSNVLLVILLVACLTKKTGNGCQHKRDGEENVGETFENDEQGRARADGVNYAALDFGKRKTKNREIKRVLGMETTYSSVVYNSHSVITKE
ncbi:uncharacterized protein LOC120524355 [Polypterus senegalus]|uniref:uncharacterized protein LOC120524355 n=1 Tax=Polypterus senegalus TaxID=55291 RepID=UPI001964F5E9|nr:uncharacterized protein LOC120524355 [Polypterus senegalus]